MIEYTVLLTEKDIENAVDYMPLAEKMDFVNLIAERCHDVTELSANRENGDILALPPMYKENTFRKSRYLMGALVGYYLCKAIECEGGVQYYISEYEYDSWAGSHILNQLERMKKTASRQEIKDKVFDILSDYRDLERRLNAEVSGLLQVRNDPITRYLASVQMASTPENMQEALERLQNAKEELERYTKEREQDETP